MVMNRRLFVGTLSVALASLFGLKIVEPAPYTPLAYKVGTIDGRWDVYRDNYYKGKLKAKWTFESAEDLKLMHGLHRRVV